ncbi:MAG: HlyD family efflux transporter periplasmic adaptor subunit, partial [candidate division Zixibacteria bacterium]|nr:HlyD family efflux transporter periplasmic adaptor subunit [candidate division Zixibacteria bacterium]
RNTRLAMQQNALQLDAQMAELDYQIKSAHRLFNQNRTLLERQMVSQDMFDESSDHYDYLVRKRELTIETQRQDSLFRSLQIEMLEASVARIEANLTIVRQNLDNLVLRAPVSGRLTSLNAEIGESKSRGERLGQIDVLDGYKVRAEVDEHYITRVDVDRSGEFDLSGATYHLTVTKIYPEVADGRFQIDLEFVDSVPDDLRRGQTVHVRLELDDLSNAVLLARGGFHQSTGGNWAYVVVESGDYAVKRDIRLGRKNPKVFEVLEGLEPGERVITSSYSSFGDVDRLILTN